MNEPFISIAHNELPKIADNSNAVTRYSHFVLENRIINEYGLT